MLQYQAVTDLIVSERAWEAADRIGTPLSSVSGQGR